MNRKIAPSSKLVLSLAVAVFALTLLSACQKEFRGDDFAAGADWPYYNGNPGGTHYSRLKQIDTTNVRNLKVAWTYDTREADLASPQIQTNPLIMDGRLFVVSAKGRLICLDGATGQEHWSFDPAEGKPVRTRQLKRGVAYWSDGQARRILFTFRGDLLSVDADTGQLDTAFGNKGRVDLREGMDRNPATISVSINSPGAIYKDLFIIGSTGRTPGHIRAYEVRTGKLRWIFHTIPHPGEFGYETWPKDAWKTAMGANSWAGFSLDPKRGLIFVPTASSGMNEKDMYGADRPGDNLFANTLLALDAATGKRVWHFQTVRHDIWDRDLPAAPTLVTVERDGKRIDALAQVTKSGFVFVLERATGRSLFPLEERPALPSDVPGEQTAPTQIVPRVPEPFARQQVTAENLTRRTPEAHAAVAKQLATLRSRGPFDPPSLQGTLILPGTDGGAEWGGAAFDPETGLLYVNSIELARILKLRPRPADTQEIDGRSLYLTHCAACHGADLKGAPPEFPSLVDVGERLSSDDLLFQIIKGGGRMPGFGHLRLEQNFALVHYLSGDKSLPMLENLPQMPELTNAPGLALDAYSFKGYTEFRDPDGYPALTPPWGTLNAIDLNSGRYAWKIPFGEFPELAAQGLKNTGSENYGGAVVTAGGLLFIGATIFDRKFHAYDKRTGQLLWETTLPASGIATPATYSVNGRQFVVIAASSGKNTRAKPGTQIVAFALPE